MTCRPTNRELFRISSQIPARPSASSSRSKSRTKLITIIPTGWKALPNDGHREPSMTPTPAMKRSTNQPFGPVEDFFGAPSSSHPFEDLAEPSPTNSQRGYGPAIPFDLSRANAFVASTASPSKNATQTQRYHPYARPPTAACAHPPPPKTPRVQGVPPPSTPVDDNGDPISLVNPPYNQPAPVVNKPLARCSGSRTGGRRKGPEGYHGEVVQHGAYPAPERMSNLLDTWLYQLEYALLEQVRGEGRGWKTRLQSPQPM
ncbi:hypothetical protein C8R44DRAFT_753970 [Mycena epipterygia]|nr:hypothetical protein C8R44DRAFT_753970 [Mycena epipterygia]